MHLWGWKQYITSWWSLAQSLKPPAKLCGLDELPAKLSGREHCWQATNDYGPHWVPYDCCCESSPVVWIPSSHRGGRRTKGDRQLHCCNGSKLVDIDFSSPMTMALKADGRGVQMSDVYVFSRLQLNLTGKQKFNAIWKWVRIDRSDGDVLFAWPASHVLIGKKRESLINNNASSWKTGYEKSSSSPSPLSTTTAKVNCLMCS